jgi:diguanylate cyclase (GGDEF)-like protein/PAS domain S-box-containing protein
VCELDPSGRLIAANERYVSASGYSREQLLTMSLAQLGEVQAPAGGADDSVAALTGEVRLLDRDGRQRWRRRTVVPIFDASRQVEKFICIEIDITDRKRSEQAALAHARMHEQSAAFARDAQGAASDSALAALLVRAAAAGLQAEGALLLCQGPDGGATCLAAWRPGQPELDGPACAAALLAMAHGDRARQALEAELPWGEQRARLVVHPAQGQEWCEDDRHFLDSLGAACANAAERQRSGKRLHYLATHDPLTALPNRAAFGERLEASIAAARSRSQRVPLLVIDLDHFKNVNDTLGHAAGDVLLLEAARRLRAALPSGCFVARLGGDEFSVIGPPGLAGAAIADCAHAVVEALRAPFRIDGQEVFIAASVGIAIYPRDGAGGDELVRNADTAMYSAKQQGRNRACRFEPAMNARLARRAMLETGLRNALEKHEFSLVYQPKQDLGNGRLTGFEALLRWSSQGEQVPPTEFIPVLEDCGLIVAVGAWVIETVSNQIRAWHDLGMPAVPVAINLSARQFQQENLVGTILAATRAAGIAPSMLEFELTETMLMSDPDAAQATMLRLKAAGIGLSIDDFGTGYSSLAYLKRFPLDALKIDRAFVRDLPGDGDDLAITCAVIALAHSLGLRVIAEGVEHAAQMDALRLHGCDEIQGYYYGRPMAPADCAARYIPAPPLLAEAGAA